MNLFFNGKVPDPIRPFSNGTEAMIWEGHNCDRCSKAWFPKDGNWPKESVLREYVRIGKYCKLQYWIHIGWIEGEIPREIAKQIGESDYGLKEQCMFFSDNDDDKFHYPKKPTDNTPPNQLLMPFYLQEIGIKEIKENNEYEYTQQLKIEI